MNDTYIFFNDPGHAWLQVPKAECKRLGVKPTDYSYQDRDNYYLEEDCDAGLWIEAKKAAGESFSIRDVYQENTPIRRMRRC